MAESAPQFKHYASTAAVVAMAVISAPASAGAIQIGSTTPLRAASAGLFSRVAASARAGVVKSNSSFIGYTHSDVVKLFNTESDVILQAPQEGSPISSVLYSTEEAKLERSVTFAGLSVALLAVLALFGVVHWALWVPGLLAALGVLISNAMQLNRIDELRDQ